jgi:ParB family chromosome partitioning protein
MKNAFPAAHLSPGAIFFKTIDLDRVDITDTTYRISTPTPVDGLMASIQEVGLLTPPLLRASGSDRFIIISGFKRISACRELGLDTIDVRIAGEGLSDLDCCRMAIADNANNRALNAVEQSAAVLKLSTFFDDDRTLSLEARKAGLYVNPELVKKLKKLTTVHAELMAPIASGTLPLTIALELGSLDRDSALAFLNLFETLKPTLNHQKEMLTLTREISLAGKIPAFQLIRDVTADMMMDESLDRPQKIEKIRNNLQRLRYPEIMRFEKQFQDRLLRLNLPECIRLVPPANFEGTRFTLSLTFHDISQFKACMEVLDLLYHHPDFKKILDKDIEDNPSIR